MFNNTTYDRLKYLALVLLPAFNALYFGLGQIWGFPKIEEVLGSVAVLDAVLGILLRQSNQAYKKSDARFDGSINKVEDDGDPVYSIAVEGGDPHEVIEKSEELTFKVNKDNVPEADLIAEPVKPKKRAPRKKT